MEECGSPKESQGTLLLEEKIQMEERMLGWKEQQLPTRLFLTSSHLLKSYYPFKDCLKSLLLKSFLIL